MIPRLFVDTTLAEGATVALAPEQAHYLRNVLRREAGAEILVFNARDGEFAATLDAIGKKAAAAHIGRRTRAPQAESDMLLLFAPVKRAAVELIVQKGVELGAAGLAPVFTDRTNAERIRIDRLQAIAQEAAEQCGRLSVPPVMEPTRLAETLLHWDLSRTLYFCDEAGDDPSREWGGEAGRAAPLLDVAKGATGAKAAILIGPEGGFSPDERKWLRALAFVRPATLGPHILRADTAAIVSLALWQAAAGDLRAR
jgi:16S rRNA (uracil1498-N3)-methyltransferase